MSRIASVNIQFTYFLVFLSAVFVTLYDFFIQQIKFAVSVNLMIMKFCKIAVMQKNCRTMCSQNLLCQLMPMLEK